MKTYTITKTDSAVTIDFDIDYFYANCNNATIDFNELGLDPTFTIHFVDNQPFINLGGPDNVTLSFEAPLFDESEIEQTFNYEVLLALIATDSRFDNGQNPY